MKICIVSDLHTDIGSQPPIKWPEADALVIAGDIANSIGETLKFFKKNRIDYRFPFTAYVPGNHENYCNAKAHRTVEDTINRLRQELSWNIQLLDHGNPVKIFNRVRFIGCLSWYSFDFCGDPINNRSIWRESMNDCHHIGFDFIEQKMPWDRAVDDAKLVEEALLKPNTYEKTVVVTHTAPIREMVTVKGDYTWDRCNPFYVNMHMEKIIEEHGDKIDLWVHGHIHDRKHKIKNGVEVIANPRGYPRENPSWEPLVLEV